MDHEKWLEQHDRMMADHHLGMAEIRASHAKLEESQTKTEKTLRWAIRLAVEDARRQRKWNSEQLKRNAEFDEKMTQIASAQLENEQLLKALLQRGGNGKH